MKFKLLITGLAIACFSCSKNDEVNKSESTDILGQWKLTQILIDPGDGSGVYENVTGNDRIINFLPNGTISSNYSLCNGTLAASEVITPYNANTDQILPVGCFADGFYITYFLENENLILAGPCIEACNSKFERIE